MITWKSRTVILLTAVCILPAAGSTFAGDDPIPFSPREALGLVEDAALAWELDAQLIYLENDEALTPTGLSGRWRNPCPSRKVFFSLRSATRTITIPPLGTYMKQGLWPTCFKS